jgi:hypothetical protein
MTDTNKKKSVYLFNAENPRGLMMNLTQAEIEEHLEDGWLDSPESLKLPENDDTGISMEDAENANPQDLKNLVESYGFIVLTPEQLKAEANKMASVALDAGLDIANADTDSLTKELHNRLGAEGILAMFSDDQLIAEAESRGLKEPGAIDEEGEPLINRFIQSPTSLTKEELVTLGSDYKLGLRMSFSEQTMIDKITVAIEESKGDSNE